MIRSLRAIAHLFTSQRWDREQIREFQERRLRALVSHAYDRVPYYRRLFQGAGLKPGDIRTLADLRHIPVTTCMDTQHLPASDLVAEGVDSNRLVVHRTSGSSGQPSSIRRTAFEDRVLQAFRLSVLFRLGMKVSDQRVAFGTLYPQGRPEEGLGMRLTDRRIALVTKRHVPETFYTRLGLLRYSEVDVLRTPEEMIQELREARAEVIRAYPGTLSWLAGFLTDEDRRIIRPRFITTDSEMMTPEMRRAITEGFRAPVFDFYDSHEFNMIAYECAATGLYHLSDASVIAQVVHAGREAGPDEEGELVGTALHSWAMPFIRYSLRDWVTRGPEHCPCGAPNTTLRHIQGRVMERFHLADGTTFHPYQLVRPLLKTAGWIRRFQIVQEAVGRIRVRLVPVDGGHPGPDAVAGIASLFASMPGITVEVDIVSEILPSANGKYRPYLSLI